MKAEALAPGVARRHWRAAGILLLATAASGLGFVFGKASLLMQGPFAPGESTWFLAAQNMVPRFALGVLLLGALHGAGVLRLTAREWAQAGFMAVCSFAGSMLQTDGLQYTTASVTAFITQFYVVLIPLWAALAHRRRPGWPVFVAGLLVLAGVAELAQLDWRSFRLGRGETEVLAASGFFSLLVFGLTWEGWADNRPERAVAGMFAVETALFAALALALQRGPAGIAAPLFSPVWLALIGGVSILGTVGPFIVMSRWQRFVGATEAGLIYSLSPVFSAMGGLFLPGLLAGVCGIAYANETASRALVIGGLLILAANALVQLRPAPKSA